MLKNLDGTAKKMENYGSQLNYINKNNDLHNQELNAMLARLTSEEIQKESNKKTNSYFQNFTNFVKTTYQQIIKIPSTILSFVSYYSTNHGYQSIQNAEQNTDNATENNKSQVDLEKGNNIVFIETNTYLPSTSYAHEKKEERKIPLKSSNQSINTQSRSRQSFKQ